MTDRELMQQALEALEEINKLSVGENAICLPAEIDTAMDALRERLAQPEQEPVAHVYLFEPNGRPRVAWDNAKDIKIGDKLYTAPPQRKPLTDGEIWSTYKNLWMFHPAEEPRLAGDVLKFARAIEAAHGIKD